MSPVFRTMLATLALTGTVLAQNTNAPFHFQGRLSQLGAAQTGSANFRIALFDAATGGRDLTGGFPLVRSGVPVTDGLFSLELAFGAGLLQGEQDLWLQIQVQFPSGSGPFVTMNPRQKIVPAPRSQATRGLEVAPNGHVGIGSETTVASTHLHVRGPGRSGPAMGHVAMFENTLSSPANSNGIAIKINRPDTNIDDNFVTFLNGQNGVAGRIEGYDLQNDDWLPPPSVFTDLQDLIIDPMTGLPRPGLLLGGFPGLVTNFDFSQFPLPTITGGALPSASLSGGTLPSASLSGGSLPSATFSPGSLPSLSFSTTRVAFVDVITGINFNGGSLPSLSFSPGSFPTLNFNRGSLPNLNFNPGTLPTVVPPPPDSILPSLLDFAGLPDQTFFQEVMDWAVLNNVADLISVDPVGLATSALKLTATTIARDNGVVYGSKGADYAEWLPKLNPEDEFQMGQIVGVFGGKVSLKTEGADQVMAISRMPIVLGNMPADGDTENYEKAAFVGQVPIVVHGHVDSGDYIVPSGEEDGTAIAVAPDDLRIEHLEHLVGRAWSSSTNDIYSFINVVVGQRGGEVATVLRNQEREIEQVASANAELEQILASNQQTQQDLEDRLTALEAALSAATAVNAR